MIGVVLRFSFLVQGRDGVGNEIDVHDVDPSLGRNGSTVSPARKTKA